MNQIELLELMESVNRRRSDGSVSPRHTPAAHLELLRDFNRLVAAGYELGENDDEWKKSA